MSSGSTTPPPRKPPRAIEAPPDAPEPESQLLPGHVECQLCGKVVPLANSMVSSSWEAQVERRVCGPCVIRREEMAAG